MNSLGRPINLFALPCANSRLVLDLRETNCKCCSFKKCQLLEQNTTYGTFLPKIFHFFNRPTK